jgi:endonuclease YncB( thermonuclease family)
MKQPIFIPIIISILLAATATLVHANPIITGKVISITDGDTITVLQDRTQYKIRLYGIDCPESHQDFGARAKQFVSDLVFNKDVRVVQKDKDRYGRVVGIIYLGDTCINEEIIKAGFAWVYHRYCKDPICKDWLILEKEAGESKIGLWSHPDPVPPWEFRRGKKASSEPDKSAQKAEGLVYHGRKICKFLSNNVKNVFITN